MAEAVNVTSTEATMGTDGAIKVRATDIQTIKTAVNTYRTAFNQEIANLQNAIKSVAADNVFSGNASKGFQTFYSTNIDPIVKNEPEGVVITMLAAIDSMCDTVLEQIQGKEGVDDGLGQMNDANQGQPSTPTN